MSRFIVLIGGDLSLVDPTQDSYSGIKSLEFDPKNKGKILKKFYHIDELDPHQESYWACFRSNIMFNVTDIENDILIRIVRTASYEEAVSFADEAWFGDRTKYKITALQIKRFYSL